MPEPQETVSMPEGSTASPAGHRPTPGGQCCLPWQSAPWSSVGVSPSWGCVGMGTWQVC